MSMKKILAVAALTGAVSAPAFALSDVRFYGGAEVDLNSPKFREARTTVNDTYTAKKKKPGVGLFAGAMVTENLGVEAGYQFFKTSKGKTNTNLNASAKLSNMYLDAMGYLPMSNEVDLIASIGLGRLKPTVKVDNRTMQDGTNKAKIGARIGGGVQYKFDNNLSARLMVRYQKAGKENSAVKNLKQVGLGMAYTF